MTWIEWYDSLAKPGWTPAPATIRGYPRSEVAVKPDVMGGYWSPTRRE